MIRSWIKKIFRNELFVNVLTLFSGSTLAQLIPFLIYPLLSRLYTPEDFGTLALFSTITSITSVFATGKYELAIMLPAKKANAINITGFCIFLIAAFWVLTMIITLSFGRQIASGLGNPELHPWIYLIPFSIAFYSVFHVMTSILNREKHYRSMAASKVVQSISTSTIKLAGGFMQVGRGGLITGTVFGQMMSAGFLFHRFSQNNRRWTRLLSIKRIKEQLNKYVYFPKYTMFHVLSNSISAGLPIFFFTRFFSTHQTGLYSMGYNITFIPLSLFAAALGQVLYQNLSKKYNSKQNLTSLISEATKTVFWLAIIPFTLLFIFAPWLFGFFLGAEWTTSGEYLRIILPWLFMALLTSPLSFVPNIFGKQKMAMFIELINFVLRLGALSAGVYFDNLKLGLILYSLSSFIVVSYFLNWYFLLTKNHDKNLLIR